MSRCGMCTGTLGAFISRMGFFLAWNGVKKIGVLHSLFLHEMTTTASFFFSRYRTVVLQP